MTAVDISKSLPIKGYMEPPELEWLAQQALTHERIAEIGSYYGRSTRVLCDHAAGNVHAYDDFYGPRDAVIDFRARALIGETFEKNLADHIASGKLIVHEDDHASVDPDGFYDMIFIDGGHEYFDVKRDLEKWGPHLAEGGLICGHDYGIAYPGLLMALFEHFGDRTIQVPPGTTIWYLTHDPH